MVIVGCQLSCRGSVMTWDTKSLRALFTSCCDDFLLPLIWAGGGDDTSIQLTKDMNLDGVVNEDNPSAYKSDILVHSTTPSVHAPELDTKDLVNKGKDTN